MKQQNTSNDDEHKSITERAVYNDGYCNGYKLGSKQGYTKALTKILKRLKYRQTKIRNLWMATKLKEYEYAKMVLEEEITLIAKEKK